MMYFRTRSQELSDVIERVKMIKHIFYSSAGMKKLSKYDRNIIICALHEKGLSYTAIAEKFNLSSSHIKNIVAGDWLDDFTNGKIKKPVATEEEIREKLLQGNTIDRTARLLGVQRSFILKKLNEMDDRQELLAKSREQARLNVLLVKKEYWTRCNPLAWWTLRDVIRNEKGQILADCICKCGKESIVHLITITKGESLSCGCRDVNDPTRHIDREVLKELAKYAP